MQAAPPALVTNARGDMAKLPDWIYRQSAVLPYRRAGDEIQVLLITSRNGARWVLPKGIVEPGMSVPASVAKEAREEAGIASEVPEAGLSDGGTSLRQVPQRTRQLHRAGKEAQKGKTKGSAKEWRWETVSIACSCPIVEPHGTKAVQSSLFGRLRPLHSREETWS